jgi:endonuclease III
MDLILTPTIIVTGALIAHSLFLLNPTRILMSASKRTRSVKLLETESPFNSSVTLFSLPEADLEDSPRRSKRIKTEHVQESIAAEIQSTSTSARVKVEKVEVADVEDTIVSSPKKRKPRATTTTASPRKAKGFKDSLNSAHPAPEDWEEVYGLIQKMRSTMIAPVDTMGCDMAHSEDDEPIVRSQLELTFV